MGGEPEKVVRMEPKGASGVFRGGGLGARVAALESRMEAVETGMIAVASSASQAATDAATAAANSAELLALANGAKKVFGFTVKHWKTALSFGCGCMTILGVGNPELWKYIGAFFGG